MGVVVKETESPGEILRAAQARLDDRKARNAAAQPATTAGLSAGARADIEADGRKHSAAIAASQSAHERSLVERPVLRPPAPAKARGVKSAPARAGLRECDWRAFECLRGQALHRTDGLPGAPPVLPDDVKGCAPPALQWAGAAADVLQAAVNYQARGVAASADVLMDSSAASAVIAARRWGARAQRAAAWLDEDSPGEGLRREALANWRAVIAESWARRRWGAVYLGGDRFSSREALEIAKQAAAEPAPSLSAALRFAPELVRHICAREVVDVLRAGVQGGRQLQPRGKRGHVAVRNSAAAVGMALAQPGAHFPVGPGGGLTIDGHLIQYDNEALCVFPPWIKRPQIQSTGPRQLSLSTGPRGLDKLQTPFSIQVEQAALLVGLDSRLARRVTLALFHLDSLASASRRLGFVMPPELAAALWPGKPGTAPGDTIGRRHYDNLNTILSVLRSLDCYVPETDMRGQPGYRVQRLFSRLSSGVNERGLLNPNSPIHVATGESVLQARGGAALFDLTGAARLPSALAQRLYLLGALAINRLGRVLRRDSRGQLQVNPAAHWESDLRALALRLGVKGSGDKGLQRLRSALDSVCSGDSPMLVAKSGLRGAAVSLGPGPLLIEAYQARCTDGSYDIQPPLEQALLPGGKLGR